MEFFLEQAKVMQNSLKNGDRSTYLGGKYIVTNNIQIL